MTESIGLAEAARRVEAETGVAAAALLAVALVETNGVAFADVGGGREPLIRFEGHYFDRLLGEEPRRRARAEGLAHAKAGVIRNPAGQAARWRLLDRAASIDRSAAYCSTSWGLGQVMGAHWHRLGFEKPGDLAAEARASAEGQLRIVARFLTLGRLDRLLQGKAFAAFARGYNGPGYRQNAYDTKIGAAYRKAERMLAAPAASPAPRPHTVAGSGQIAGDASPAGIKSPGRLLSKALSWLSVARR